MHRERMRSYSLRLLLSYLIVLVLPLGALYLTYHTSLQVVEEQTRQSNLALLTHSRDIMDGRLAEIERLGTQLLMNARIDAVLRLNRPMRSGEIYKLREAWLDIARYPVINDYLSTFFLVMDGSDVVLSPEAPYIGIQNFYRHYFSYGDMSFDQWRKLLLGTYHRRHWLPGAEVFINGRHARMLAYLQSMPSGGGENPSGTMMLLIEEARIQELLYQLPIGDGGWAGVLDEQGTVISALGGELPVDELRFDANQGYAEMQINGERMLVTYIGSTQNQWRYVSAVPMRVLMLRVAWLRRMLGNAALVIFAIGVLLAVVIVRREMRPVREQAPLLRQSFFDRLFAGEFHSDDEIDAYLKHIRFTLPGERYAVLLARLQGYANRVTPELLDALSVKRIEVRETLTRRGLICHNVGRDCVAVLFCLKQGEDFPKMAATLAQKLREQMVGTALRISSGEPCDGLLGIHTSYLQARHAMSYLAAEEAQPIAWYAQLPSPNHVYYFSLRMETQLTHLVMAGNREETEALLSDIYEQNLVRHRISLDMARQYINELYNTALKIINQLPDKVPQLAQSAALLDALIRDDCPLDEVHRMMAGLYDDICQYMASLKRSRSEGLKHELQAYVEKNVSDEALNLSAVAAAFHLTDAYVSETFKAQTGENFSGYLERIRMEHACQMLNETDVPVYQVAARVGYGNDNTFRRAFKRVYGISPTDYRGIGDKSS